jgi:hypothetical protein
MTYDLLELTMTRDLLDRPLDAHEAQLLAIYESMRTLLAADLAPCVAANVRAGLAPIAVAVADLGLRFEHLIDEGC